MKRLAVILCAALCVLLQACGAAVEESPAATSTKTGTETIALFGGSDFGEAIRDNPIDKAFEAIGFDGSTLQIIETCNLFGAYWEAEIDSAFEKLYILLRDEDAVTLRNAQRAWTEYMASNHDLRISLFYEDFMSNQPYGVASGTLDRAIINSVRKEETRRRALELMEYYFRFTGEVQFVFTGADR